MNDLSEESKKIFDEALIVASKFNAGGTIDRVLSEHNDFFEKNKALFKLCSKGGLDPNELIRMLRMRDQIRDNKISKTDGEMVMGRHFFKTYFKDKMSKEDLEVMIKEMVIDFSPLMEYLQEPEHQSQRINDPKTLLDDIESQFSHLSKKYYGVVHYFVEKNITKQIDALKFFYDFYLRE